MWLILAPTSLSTHAALRPVRQPSTHGQISLLELGSTSFKHFYCCQLESGQLDMQHHTCWLTPSPASIPLDASPILKSEEAHKVSAGVC